MASILLAMRLLDHELVEGALLSDRWLERGRVGFMPAAGKS
jgi:hypothetical protein